MQPLISIITVCYNAGALLQRTIDSVAQQEYPNIEYIVIDGGSGQSTLEIIERNRARIDQLLIEKDNGIYDAMNKGLRMAKGEFVWFLNAGDLICARDTTAILAKLIDDQVDIVYGDTMLVDDQYKAVGLRSELTVHPLPENLALRSMRFGMVVCHQSILVRRSIAPQYLPNNLSADIDWLIRSLQTADGKVVNAHLIICNYLMGGISKQKHQQSLKDRYVILRHFFGFWPNIWNHCLIVIRAIRHRIRRKVNY